ncbi:toll/interleukin-1 receptor domain-containing protein [Arthrobacter sp. BPSS-3]|uniref:toll/interleukin-1 receptor domain-containing protein n=1 Tax=Arthrobacter sp. BPSS-3 TaxID=3366580 RepID=UPI0037DD0FF4
MTTTSTQATSSKIEAFLSYAHESDQHLNLVEPLHKDLVGMIKLRSNRDVEIFRDKIDLQWGVRFRATIDSGLTGASVLFVIATTHYLASDSCREEFKDFLNAAKSTGRDEMRRLILPIMPIAAPSVFKEDSDDEVAAEIASIQYELIEDAVIAGPGSADWKKAIIRLADRFIEVVTNAEAEAASVEVAVITTENEGADDDADDRGYFDAMADLESDFEDLTRLTGEIGPLLETAVTPLGDIDFSSITSAKQMNAKLALASRQILPFATQIAEKGRAVRDKANSIDVSIRHLVRISTSGDVPTLETSMRDFLKNAQSSLGDTATVVAQMDGLLMSMATAEATSSLMRNALKPMRSGITAMNDTIAVIQKWGPELMD